MKTGKKALSILLSVIMVLGVCAVGITVSADDEGGFTWNETESRYEISDYDGLRTFAKIVNGVENPDNLTNPQSANAILTADIDASASDPDHPNYDAGTTAWTPIGNDSNSYTGTFDGMDSNGIMHTITGLTFNNPEQRCVGLFGYVYYGGVVRNVGLEDGSITGKNYVGGVTGQNYGTITNCHNTGEVSGEDYVGGVAGYNHEGTITYCYNTGDVTATDSAAYAGGVAGSNDSGEITNCYNTGDVSGEFRVGGVVGVNDDTIENCYNTGNVSCYKGAGGVAGQNYGTITNCYNTGDVTAKDSDAYAGGVVGENLFSYVSNCYNTGDVTAKGNAACAGGVVGYNIGSVSTCYNTGEVSVTNYSGGVVGKLSDGEVSNCYYDKGLQNLYGTNLTTAEMTAGTYTTDGVVTNMPGFSSDTWLVRESDEFYSYYPHLKGFDLDGSGNQIPAEDIRKTEWPARILKNDAREISDYAELKAFAEEVNSGSTGLKGILIKDIDASASDPDNPDYNAGTTAWTPIGPDYSNSYAGTFEGDGHVITGLTTPEDFDGYAGLFGCVGSNGIVRNVGLEGGSITGGVFAGGVVGWNSNNGTVQNCYNTGSVNGTAEDSQTGGIAGANNGTIKNSYFTGTVSSSELAGGIAGGNGDGNIIQHCYNTGSVTGANEAGGLTGSNYGTVRDCYNTGSVTATEDGFCAGGTAGENVGLLINCYNTGSVAETGFRGGIAGYSEEGTVQNCFYDSSVLAGMPAVNYPESYDGALSTAEMTGSSALENMVFTYDDGETNPWLVKANDSTYSYYPHLKGFNLDEEGQQLPAESIETGNWPPKIMKEDPGMELTISTEQPVWGDNITITATLPESATGTVIFRLDEADTGVEVAVENGKAVYAIEGKSIEVGDYTVLASYSGDERYNSVSEELPLAVYKAETEVHITVEPENPLSGQDVSITATVDGDAKIINFSEHGSTSLGGATLLIDGGVIYTLASETDTVTFNVPGLDAGEHTIKVVYNGDEHYWSAEGETTIFVGRSEPEITVTAEDITYGEAVQATVTVPGNATGNITAGLLKYGGIDPDTNEEIWNAVNGAPASITSGEQFEISGLAAGDYKLTVSLGEDSNYFSGSAEKAFKVNKAEPDMSVTVTPQNPASDGTFTLTVNLPDDATGDVIIRFNEVDLLGYIKLAEGNSQQFECLQAGTYHGTAKYLPADGSNYAEKEITFEFNVSAAAPNMTLTAEDITYGETATVTANLPTDTMWGSVTFFLDNADTGKEVYVSQGKAVCTFSDLNAGEHTVEAVFANDDKYADETKTITFNVAQKALTITANNQSYPYNGQTQGEGDTVYEDSAVIKEKVAVDGLVEGDALTSITLDGAEKEIGEYAGRIVPSDAVIGDKTANYNISYTAGKLTIASVSCPLTINYVYAEGGEAAETHEEDVAIFSSYSVTSPEITGCTPDKATVEGTIESVNGVEVTVIYTANTYKLTWVIDGEDFKNETVTFGSGITEPDVPGKDGYTFAWTDEIPETMPAEDITINGKYTAIEYTATFVDENGKTVDTRTFTVLTESIDEPDVPAKEGYEGKWGEYTIAASDMEITAEYTPIEYTATFIADGETVDTRTFTVKTESIDEPDVPAKEGYEGKWGEYTIAAGDMEITAKYTPIEYTATFVADGVTVDTRTFTVETESIDEPGVPEKEGFTGEWEEYELTPGDITVNAVYTEVIPEDLCPLDNEDHGDGFIGRVLTFIHTLVWKAFRLLGLNVFFKVS